MSDVIISRRNSGGGSSTLITEYIESNRVWTVPNNAKSNKFSVRIIGSGGWTYGSGGASGWMNNDVLTLTPGQSINITIANQNGQTTSFGTYLSAAGGYTAQVTNVNAGGGSGGSGAAVGYQFGGGGQGGNGGPWGGGGGGWFGSYCNGGHGGIYGGGGGGGHRGSAAAKGGNGGTYGGGGGGACAINAMGTGGIGGEYGGNGGNSCNPVSNTPPTVGENGTNTIGWTNLMKFDDNTAMTTGNGKAGSLKNTFRKWGGGTGGGGFGGIGGDSWLPSALINNQANHGGGGGGGYGSNGGTGGLYNAGGGGGGYGKISKGGGGGGGGYYCPAGGLNKTSGCGGGLGILSNDGTLIKSYGSGGLVQSNSSSTATLRMQPEPGVCIIQYTLK